MPGGTIPRDTAATMYFPLVFSPFLCLLPGDVIDLKFSSTSLTVEGVFITEASGQSYWTTAIEHPLHQDTTEDQMEQTGRQNDNQVTNAGLNTINSSWTT